jgi:hypothetical protein
MVREYACGVPLLGVGVAVAVRVEVGVLVESGCVSVLVGSVLVGVGDGVRVDVGLGVGVAHLARSTLMALSALMVRPSPNRTASDPSQETPSSTWTVNTLVIAA